MDLALTLVAVVAIAVLVGGLSERRSWNAPLVLIAVGVAGSYLPFVPEVRLSADTVLLGLLPPLLYAAAIRTSLVDFRKHRAAILSLSVGLVLLTALAVGLVAWWLLPIPFPVALALGAVVSPPDAVAATTVARRIGLPRQVVTVLEGESLLNDATALVTLRTALAAVGLTAGHTTPSLHPDEVTPWGVALDFAWAAGGGIALGVVVAVVVARLRRKRLDATLDTAVSFLTPFVAYLGAELLGASGVLAVVAAGLVLGHRSLALQTAAGRLAERINWSSIQFILESAVFLLMGLQLAYVIDDALAFHDDIDGVRIALAAAAVLLTVLGVRPVWLLATRFVFARNADTRLGGRESVVASWAGMRGVVTLAAAFLLPPDTPARDVLVLIAMVVALGTLALQGLTLPWVARRFRVRGPDPHADALQEAVLTQRAVTAGLAVLEDCDDEDPQVIARLRERAVERAERRWERVGPPGTASERPIDSTRRLRMAMLEAERAELVRIRDSGEGEHEVLSRLLAEMDVEEAALEQTQERDARLVRPDAPARPIGAPEDGCEHLAQARASRVPRPAHPRCLECAREGTDPVHLRQCLTCGHVACCDSSVGRHADAHRLRTSHPVIRSVEPGEDWRWCYVDECAG